MTTAIVLPLPSTPLLPTTPDTVLRRDESGPCGALPVSAAPCRLHPGVPGTMATVWFGDQQ